MLLGATWISERTDGLLSDSTLGLSTLRLMPRTQLSPLPTSSLGATSQGLQRGQEHALRNCDPCVCAGKPSRALNPPIRRRYKVGGANNRL